MEVMGDENNYDSQFEQDVQDVINKLPDSRIFEIVCDSRSDRYYVTFVQQRVQLYTMAAEEQKYALDTSDLILPEQPTWLKTRQQYLGHLRKKINENIQRLKLLQANCLRLRDFISTDIEMDKQRNKLSKAILRSLIRKVKALNVHYAESTLITDGESLPLKAKKALIAW
jgi:hypothetical protein